MINKKLFDSFVVLECPWCKTKLFAEVTPPLLYCKSCGLWTHNRVSNGMIDRHAGPRYLERLIKIKEYYEQKPT